MPLYRITAPNGLTYQIDGPPGASDDQVAQAVLAQNPEAGQAPKAAPFSLSDTALAAAQSALGATKSTIEGVTGAGSAPGEYLDTLQKSLGAKMTPERQAEMQRRAALEKRAAETGRPLEEVAAGLGGVKEAPIQTFAQAAGSSVPTVLLGVGAGALGATLGAPVAIAAGVGIAAKYLIGAIQGAGEVKGTIYDTVKDKLVENNVPEAEARRQALAAQDYMGKNWDTIAQGLGLGAVAGGTGMETELLKKFSKPVAKQIAAKEAAKVAEKGALREFAGATGKEAFTEGLQGGQQQFAENKALTREGYITDAMKGVYGAAARDAAMGAIGGGGVHALVGRTPAAEPAPTPQPGPQVSPEAPAGTQGALFDGVGEEASVAVGAPVAETYAELVAERDRLQAEPTSPETRAQLDAVNTKLAGNAPDAQLGLGLDFQREYADLLKERAKLTQQPQTPEVKARVSELTDQIMSLHENEVESLRAEKQANKDTRDMFPGLAAEPAQQGLFPELDVVRPDTAEPRLVTPPKNQRQVEARRAQDEADAQAAADTAQKEQERKGGQYRLPLRSVPEDKNVNRNLKIPARPTEITMQDLEDIGVPLRTSKKWLEANVVGKTPAEIQVLVANDPSLILRKGSRAEILKYLTAPVPEGFKEEPSVTPTTQTSQPEPVAKPRGGKPSVGVSGKPASTNVVQPRAGVPATTGAPATPIGLGLAPAGQPAGKGVAAQTAVKPTLNAPTTTTAVTPPAAPAAPVAKPPVAAKPAPKAAPAKKSEAPAPVSPAKAVETETAAEEAARKREAEEMRKAMEAPTAKPAPKAVAPATETKAEKPVVKELPEKLREPVGTSEFGMEEGDVEIQRGPQGMLFPMSKREEREYAEDKQRDIKAEAEKPTKTQMVPRDARQGRLDLQERKEEPKAKALPEWSTKLDTPTSTTVYADDNIALVREHNMLGQYVFVGRSKDGQKTRVDIDRYTGKLFTDEQLALLRDERSKAVFAESKKFAKNPDGPFTRAKTNVAKSESVDQRYADYLHGLMQELGLGNVRIFLVNPEDMAAPDAVEKYKLYKDYASVKTAGQDAGEEGSKRTYGPERRDFYISFMPGMSENKTLEVISHELGHAIQNIAYDNAPQKTKDAIKTEYEKWLASTKGKTGRELVQMLRNRETADTQMLTVSEGKTADQMEPYWTSFNEWFADNVSRWASTNEKPLSVTEKFFSKVAQMMRDLVAVVTGRKYPPAKSVADFLNKMGPDDAKLWLIGKDEVAKPSARAEFSVSYSTESLIDSMGPLSAENKSGLAKLIEGFKANPEISYVTKVRTQVADIAATIEERLRKKFDGAVRNSLGELNPMGLYRQAQDYSKMLLEYFQTGTLYKDSTTGQWMSGQGEGGRPPSELFTVELPAYAKKNGYSKERAAQIASRVLEGVRLDGMRKSNNAGNTKFKLHLNDAQIDQLLAEYNADPDLQKMSKLMDEARIAMVNNLIKVGRLTKEQGEEWKSVVGYVPFDRIEDFATNFNKAKKISGKGIAQLGKLPELIGSEVRPVGNVFENYINTLGWMVGQTLKTDATTITLRSLQDVGAAKYLGLNKLGKPNAVGSYVNGEMYYWELPSKYDVMAFKDLNAQKAGWLRNMGAFSNVLRRTITALPPFALKQVTDDVQRAIVTSGVRNAGALVRMSLTNFPKLALAELRGIRHPEVRDMERKGLSGEFDFKEGKPAASLLMDLGYDKRSRFDTLMHRLEGITRASDLAVRKAIYDQTMKESNDELLAQTRAREFINFRRRGASEFVGAMVTTVPFFNAYIQGMDVVYRAASGKDSSASVDRAQARRLFWSRAATVMMLSSLYALGKDDEDKDYKEMDLRTRDGNWILPGGVKLPVPGELGAVFKVIPERIVEYMKRQGTPEEQTAFEATRTTLAYMYEQYVGRAVPVPQAIKPVIEAWSNKSFLTGRELEGYHHKAMDPSARVTEQTSELAKAISVFSRDQIGVEVSPIMIDNSLRGYFGSTAAMFTMVTDSLLNPTRVDRPLHKYALLSNYMYDPVGTRRMTEFYDLRENVGKANTTLNELAKTDVNRAEQYAIAHADELQLEGIVNSTLQQLEDTRAYRKWLNSPDGAADMSTEQREAELKEIKQQELNFVQWVREAKAELRKVQ